MERKLRYAIAIGWTVLIFVLLTSFMPNKKITLELTVEETQLVLDALAELPAKKSFTLMSKIINESQAQLKAK
jgi:hypothetical protein